MPLADGARVWHVERLTPELSALLAAAGSGIRRCRELPLVDVPADHPRADDPPDGAVIAETDSDAYRIALAIDRVLAEIRTLAEPAPNGNRWVAKVEQAAFIGYDSDRQRTVNVEGYVAPTAVGYPGVLTLSLQTWPGKPPGEHAPISVAVRAASEVLPVVVAAGNWRQMGAGDTLNPLAKLPGVISVAATLDAEGTVMAPTSSMGGLSGLFSPTLTAWGRNPFVEGVFQTSFAAAAVGGYALCIRAFLLQLRSARITHDTGRLAAVPLLASFTIDSGFLGFDPRPQLPLPMLPYSLGLDVSGCAAAFAELDAQGVAAGFVAGAAIVEALLLRAAVPMPFFAAHEVGAGFVSDESIRRMLSALRFTDLLAIAGVAHEVTPSLERVIARADNLPLLFGTALQSRVSYGLNFRTGAVHAVELGS